MRKSIWIMLTLMFVAIAAPNAHADSVNMTFSGVLSGTATLTVTPESGGTFLITSITGSLTSPVTGAISLIVPPNFFDDDNNIIDSLSSFSGDVAFSDAFGDEWLLYTRGGNTFVDGTACQFLTGCNTIGAETVTLSSPVTTAPTPEPGTIALMLLGVGVLFVMRKRLGRGLIEVN